MKNHKFTFLVGHFFLKSAKLAGILFLSQSCLYENSGKMDNASNSNQNSDSAVSPKIDKTTTPPSTQPVFCRDSVYGKYLTKHYRHQKLTMIARKTSDRYDHKEAIFRVSQTLSPLPAINSDLPFAWNSRVFRWVNFYTQKGRFRILKRLYRMQTQQTLITDMLEQKGLPKDLIFLAMIESGFNNQALSRSKAMGTWQFMKPTGSHYGLRVNYWIDERRDLQKSTLAAANYLQDLYQRFGKWGLAITAYNAGPGRVSRAMKKQRTGELWKIIAGRHLRSESKNYLAKIIAVQIITQNQNRLGFTITPLPPQIPMATASLTRPLEISELAKKMALSKQDIKKWNPTLSHNITPPMRANNNKPFSLHLPKAIMPRFHRMKKNLANGKIQDLGLHRIRSGDTLTRIARRYRVPLKKLASHNPRVHPRKLRIGQKITIPLP